MNRRNASYLLSLFPSVLVVWGNLTGGWWSFANFLFTAIVLGLLELMTPAIRSNEHSSASDPFPEAVLFAHVPAHTLCLISLVYGIFSGILTGPFVWLATISTAVEAGTGAIVVAHELIHKAVPLKQYLGKYLLASSGNCSFYIHHLRIHHRFVGTSEDAATARFGESLYRYHLRTVPGQFREAWKSETSMLAKQGKTVWSLRNMMLRNLLVQLLIVWGMVWLLGLKGLLIYVVYAFMARLLLEYVNYIEHYGLQRTSAERVTEHHSWNSDKAVSRFFLVELSRHADHHFYASKPYHTLNTYKHSPTLPGGYMSLLLPALIPAWWKALIHPRLEQYRSGSTSEA